MAELFYRLYEFSEFSSYFLYVHTDRRTDREIDVIILYVRIKLDWSHFFALFLYTLVIIFDHTDQQ